MMKKVSVILEVPFFDVDAMQIVWHGHYVKYLEIARCELLRTFDYDYPQMQASGYMWPIVELNLKYRGSARFGKKIEVVATLVEWEHRLKINYRITDVESGQTLTKASTVQVAVDQATQQLCFESPKILLSKLGIEA
jgi:acyl-CoA thioester hydrolase